jgi:hypothetical protein
MAYIENEGRFNVKITDIQYVDELGWDNDPSAYKLIFWGETPDGLKAKSELIFSSKEFWDKQENKNVSRAFKSQRTLEQCGVPDGNIAELPKILTGELDFQCVFVGKKNDAGYLNFYMNPTGSGKSINEADFSDLANRFAAMTGKKAPEAPAAPPPFPVEESKDEPIDTTAVDLTDDEIDDIPF